MIGINVRKKGEDVCVVELTFEETYILG